MEEAVIIVHFVKKGKSKMKKVAITGTIGSGKSTVSILFRRNGVPVFDADGYAKLCLAKSHPAYQKIVERFGNSILNEFAEIDRSKLASVIFNNEENRLALNAIVHPCVKEGLLQFFERYKDVPLVAAEVPLLYEGGWEVLFDEVIVVTCEDSVAIERLIEYRNFTKEDAEKRLASQIDKEEQIQKANTVIYNNGSLKELNTIVEKYIEEVA